MLCALLSSPASAQAETGLYIQLGGGYGDWSGTDLVTAERDNGEVINNGCCPSGTVVGQARLGFSILGIAAPEGFVFLGGWRHGDNSFAAGGFAGGGLRVYPLGILEQLRLMDLDGFPLELSLAGSLGYARAGSNAFGYEGLAVGFDLKLDWLISSFFSIGAKIDFWFPQFDPFVTTNQSANQGLCLDRNARPITDDDLVNGNLGGGVINKDDRDGKCPSGGRGPQPTVVSPQLVATFRFNLF
ncbi:MAG: hypothetical protein KTR25_19870 [Myxococcales bacterium]|nr:hypothetical protein [Myxococcales bacterium]